MEELLEDQYKELRDVYEETAETYDMGKRIALAALENIKKNVRIKGRKPHIEIISRTKTFSSVLEKCKRKGIKFDIEDIKKNINDIIGIRIVTIYMDDIIPIKDAILGHPLLAVREERDYITQPKDNGYSGYHLIVTVNERIDERTISIPVEIQIRTKGMDLWASVEHDCCYKCTEPSEEATTAFSKIAKILREFEKTAICLRNNIHNSKN